eukprot:5003366-Prymnesium_polylepis.1
MCASVHSAALSACCQAWQTLMRPWVASPSFDRAILVIGCVPPARGVGREWVGAAWASRITT